MGKAKLGPGFRFRPTDVELVRYYLRRKVLGKKLLPNDAIAEINIYKFHPDDLPGKSLQRTGELKWYFFCPRGMKYSTGKKARRSTESGYWKVSGKDRTVTYNNEVVGRIRTLVFHSGKKRYGERTDWIIHEYELDDKELEQKNVPQDAYVLCILFKKNGVGPKHGDEYGAPFKDEDWSDHEEDKDTEKKADPGPSKETSLLATGSHSHGPNADHTPRFEVAPLEDDDLYEMDQFFGSILVDRFDGQNEVIHDEPLVDEALTCLEDKDFRGMSDFSDDLFIELQDLTEPVITPSPGPAQAGDHHNSRSSGQTKDQI